MPTCFADRLIDAVVAKRTPGIVNIDPVLERLPPALVGPRESSSAADVDPPVERIKSFCRGVLQVVAPIVPAVKLNIAYFECFGPAGIRAYQDLIRDASDHGLIVIGDVKRGDVGHTAARYARAQLAEPIGLQQDSGKRPDAVTVSGYFGWDGVEPFVDVAREEGKGVFVLVRTSNPTAADLQDVVAEDGRKLHEHVACLVARWAEESGTIGERGYASVGAVVATRDRNDAARLRAAMPRSLLLVPGYGAQGAAAEDVGPYFKADGFGAIVAAGRSVIFAHERPEYQSRLGEGWRWSVEQACRDFTADLSRVVDVGGP